MEVSSQMAKQDTSIVAGIETVKTEENRKVVQTRNKPRQRKFTIDNNGIGKGYLDVCN